MTRPLTLLIVVVLAGFEREARATVLGDAARSMKAGEWLKLSTPANAAAINVMNIAVYADSWVWNPVTKKGLFVGSYHNGPRTFAIYDDATHSWSSGPLGGSGPRSGNIVGHGYEGNALDPATGTFYFRDCTPPRDIYRYPSGTGAWSVLPGNGAYRSDLDPTAYFPELGGLVWINIQGEIHLFRESTGQWTKVGDAGIGFTTWNFAEYNPIHKIMIIGSSNGQLCKLSAAGQVTRLNNMPVSIYDGSGFTGHVTVDPVSGDFLVLTAANAQLHRYRVLTDTWSNLNTPPPASMQNIAAVSAQVGTYGVNLFMACGYYASECYGELYIYKHSAGTGVETGPGLEIPAGIEASPNPFKGDARLVLKGAGIQSLRSCGIYNSRGTLVGNLTVASAGPGNSLVWNAQSLAPGVYLLRADLGGRRLSKTLVLMK